MIDTPRTDRDDRPYPSPEHTQRIQFEGCECVVMAPEDYESLYDHARQLERELAARTEKRDALRLSFERDAADDSDSPGGHCTCLTKTPDIQHHKRGCKYRLIIERDDYHRKACDIADQRDTLRARVAELEKERNALRETLKMEREER